MASGEGKSDAATHGGTGDHGARPGKMVEHRSKVVGDALDPIGSGRLVGAAMAPAVDQEDVGLGGQPPGHGRPEAPVHRQGMQQREPMASSPARQRVRNPAAVIGKDFAGFGGHDGLSPQAGVQPNFV
jgi:hypothetical protein